MTSEGNRPTADRPVPWPRRTSQLLLLDGFRLLHDSAPAVVPRGLQRVLALIALRPGTTRTQLAGLLWPDTPERRALSSLRTALWRLRREGVCPLRVASDTVELDRTVEVDVDRLVWIASRVGSGTDPEEATRVLTAGRHDLLPGWYDEWVLLERERLRQLRLHALEEIARLHLRAGRHGAALQAAIEAMRAEPLRETPHRLIVQIHLAEGNVYEALQAFYVYRDLLRRDLQLEPSPAMSTLLEPVLARLQRSGLPPPALWPASSPPVPLPAPGPLPGPGGQPGLGVPPTRRPGRGI